MAEMAMSSVSRQLYDMGRGKRPEPIMGPLLTTCLHNLLQWALNVDGWRRMNSPGHQGTRAMMPPRHKQCPRIVMLPLGPEMIYVTYLNRPAVIHGRHLQTLI